MEVSFDVKIPSYHLMNTDENLTFNCLYTILSIVFRKFYSKPNHLVVRHLA